MNNVKSAITRHNSHIIRKSMPQDENMNSCNCRSNSKCPLNGQCMKNNIVYKATVTADNTNTMHYIGMTANTFKERFRNHTISFRNKKYANETELSKHIWKLKEKKRTLHHNMVDFKTR